MRHATPSPPPSDGTATARPAGGFTANPVIEMANSMIMAQVVNVAARLGIADALRAGPRDLAELAAAVGAQPGPLRRVLRAMVCFRLLREPRTGTYALTPLGELLRSDLPDSTRSMVLMCCDSSQWRAWGGLLENVTTGATAFQRELGVRVYDYYLSHPEVGENFHRTMTENTKTVAHSILEADDFGAAGTIVDVGGGSGLLLSLILAAHPQARGILFDTELGVQGAEENLKEAGTANRCTIVTGDFFTKVPTGGRTYLLKDILHGCDDERGLLLLRRCREAVPHDGRLVLLETLLPETMPEEGPLDPADSGAVFMDLTMLVTTGGQQRTEGEFAALLDRAGFAPDGVTPLRDAGYHLITARPRPGATS